jgi:hypothetical protein
MKSSLLLSLGLGAIFLSPLNPCTAASLSFSPTTSTVLLGDSVRVNIVISGLGNASAPS